MKKHVAPVLLAVLLAVLPTLSVLAENGYFLPESDVYDFHDYVELTVGETVSLVPMMVAYDSERERYAVGPRVWSSRDPEIASVSERGYVTALKEGFVEVRVSYMTNLSERVTETVRVMATREEAKQSSAYILRVNIGKFIDLRELFFPGTRDGDFQWKLTDAFMAEVDEDGLLEAVVAGSCTINATHTAEDGTVTRKAAALIVSAEHHGSINQIKLTLAPGETIDLVRAIFPDEKRLRGDECLSSKSTVAEVGEDQRITAKKSGEAVVTVVKASLREELRQRVQIVVS